MRRTEPLRLDKIIEKMIDATGLRDDYTRHTAESMWPAVVGPNIAAYTGRLYVKDRTLHAYITSASLRDELGYVRGQLTDSINDMLGEKVIDNIVLH